MYNYLFSTKTHQTVIKHITAKVTVAVTLYYTIRLWKCTFLLCRYQLFFLPAAGSLRLMGTRCIGTGAANSRSGRAGARCGTGNTEAASRSGRNEA